MYNPPNRPNWKPKTQRGLEVYLQRRNRYRRKIRETAEIEALFQDNRDGSAMDWSDHDG